MERSTTGSLKRETVPRGQAETTVSKQQKESNKKTAILEATLELIAEQGFHNTPTSQIAERARVGVGSIYRYFQDKDELIHELFHYVSTKENMAILKECRFEGPIREQYIHLCLELVKFSVEHPKESRFLEQYFNSPYGILRRREELLRQESSDVPKGPLHALFETARAQQIMKDLPTHILAALTFGPIFALLRDILADLIEYDADLMYNAIEACWDAVKR